MGGLIARDPRAVHVCRVPAVRIRSARERHGSSEMPGLDRNYYVVDAFSTGPFTGNPAAVVCDAAGLDDDTMRRIAAEFNLSETTFFLPPKISHSDPEVDLSVRIRWFTPTVEVDMCGHATVAGVHALVESGRLPTPTSEASCVVRIETKSGVLTAYVEHFPGLA